MRKFNFKIVVHFSAILVALNTFFMLLCLPVSLYYKDGSFKGILGAAIINLIISAIAFFVTKNHRKDIQKREGYLIVTLGWLIMSLAGSLPYLLTGSIPNFTDAFFETISGYSTTGSSIMTDIEAMPKAILLWRSLTHWIGGMGIIVLAVAILPLLGIGGMQLFVAEAPGPSADKLHPRITETAKRLWVVYLVLTIAQFILLWAAGMTLFDAINHALCTLSTGGFSTKNSSVAYWNNEPLIQYIIIVFMFIAGINFVLNYFALQGKFRKVIENEEFRYYCYTVFGFTFVSTLGIIFFAQLESSSIVHPMVLGMEEAAFRHSLFQVLAVITTTGFVTADFTAWTPLLTMAFFSLMFIGGSAGSTSGGVKIVRHIILLKNSLLAFKQQLHPNAIIPVRYNTKAVKKNIVNNILSFFIIYMLIFAGSAILFSAIGLDLETALGVAATSLGNVGPALGSFSPVDNFSAMPIAGKWLCSFLMLLGRLELFTVLILITPFFWRKKY